MKYLKHVIALVITAVCLYIAFHGVELGQAFQIISRERIRVVPILLFSALSLAVMAIRAWRWKYFFRQEHQATVWGLTVSNIIGFATNNILPLRIGEVVRWLMARKKVNARLSYILATLFIERFLDTLCLLLCFIIPMLFSGNFPPFVIKVGGLMAIVFAGALLILFILRFKPDLAMKISLPVGRKIFAKALFERFEHFLVTFTEGLKILRDGSAMWKISVLSLFHWWLVVFSYGLAFRGFSIGSLPWTAPYLTLGFVGLGVALPSAPAFVGPLHAAIIYSLNNIYGVDRNTAVGFAVIMHLLMMAPVTLAGLILLWKEGLTLGQLRKKTEHIDEEPPLSQPSGAPDQA